MYQIENSHRKSQKNKIKNKKPGVKSSSPDNYIITQQLVCIALRNILNHFCFKASFKYDTIVLIICLSASTHLFLWPFTVPLSVSKHTLYVSWHFYYPRAFPFSECHIVGIAQSAAFWVWQPPRKYALNFTHFPNVFS